MSVLHPPRPDRRGALSDAPLRSAPTPGWSPPPWAVIIALAIGATVLVAGRSVPELRLAAVALAGLAILPVLLTRPRVLLVVLVVAEVANLGDFSAGLGFSSLMQVLMAVSLVCLVVQRSRAGWRLVFSPVLGLGALFLATQCLSLLGASDKNISLLSLEGTAKDLVICAVILIFSVNVQGERLIAGTAVVTASALCGLDLLREFVVGNTVTFFGLLHASTVVDLGLTVTRHTGPVNDPNFWGRILLMIVPLSLALFADRRAGRQRWCWLVPFALLLGGVYLTGSRGTLLAGALVILIWALLSGRRYARKVAFAPVVAALVMAIPGVGSRLATLGDVTTTAGAEADASLTDRYGAAEVSMRMFFDHPLLGVGVQNFQFVEQQYLRFSGIGGAATAPHDLYLEFLAESGLIGLMGWLAFFIASIGVVLRTRVRLRPMSRGEEPSRDWLLSGAVLAALTAWAFTGFTLHIDNLRIYGLVLAIGASLDVRTRVSEKGFAAAGVLQYYRDLLRPVRTAALVAGAVFVVVACATMGPFAFPQQWTATETIRPVPSTGDQPVDAYTLNVQTRKSVSLTYLALLSDPVMQERAMAAAGLSAEERATTTISATPEPGGIILLSVDADNPQVANVVLGALPTAVDEGMTRPQPLFHFEVLPGSRTAPVAGRHVRPVVAAASVAAAFLAAFASFLLCLRQPTPIAPRREFIDCQPRGAFPGGWKGSRR